MYTKETNYFFLAGAFLAGAFFAGALATTFLAGAAFLAGAFAAAFLAGAAFTVFFAAGFVAIIYVSFLRE